MVFMAWAMFFWSPASSRGIGFSNFLDKLNKIQSLKKENLKNVKNLPFIIETRRNNLFSFLFAKMYKIGQLKKLNKKHIRYVCISSIYLSIYLSIYTYTSMMWVLSAISSPLSSTKGRRPRLLRSFILWSTF